MVSLHIILILSTVLALSRAEIIKLENKEEILCVTDVMNSVMYVYPPVVEDSRDDTILTLDDELWSDSGWVLKNSKEVIVPMVLDKRFESFATIYTNNLYFPYVMSLSFSTTATNLSTTIKDPVNKSKEQRNSIDWIDTSFSLVNNDTNINNFLPFQINSSSTEDAYWKVHDYNFRWAESSSETATVVHIEPLDFSCMVLYTFLCPYCTLNITVGGSFFMLQGSLLEKWTSHTVSVPWPINMTISRSTTQTDTTMGQWAMDIRRCPPTKSNKTILAISLENDVEPGANRSCRQAAPKRSIPIEKTNTNTFNCSSGLLGRACDISCEALLSSDLKYCQQYQICDDSFSTTECFCAWGYQGTSCEEECNDGNWGLSCQSGCSNCQRCNGQTGECTSSASILNKGIGLLIFSILWAILTQLVT